MNPLSQRLLSRCFISHQALGSRTAVVKVKRLAEHRAPSLSVNFGGELGS